MARYATRVVLATGKVKRLEGGRVRIETPPDPKTGRTWLELDEIEFVHAVCQQVPARGLHLVRYQGVYANRLRRAYREARAVLAGEPMPEGDREDAAVSLEDPPSAAPGSADALRRQAWARMLRKVLEVDPLICPRCRREGVPVEMEVVAWITDLDVVDRILRHRRGGPGWRMEPDDAGHKVEETQGGRESTLAGGPRDGWGGLNVLGVPRLV